VTVLPVREAQRGERQLNSPGDKDSPEAAVNSPESTEASSPEDLSEVIDFSSYDLRTTIRLIVLSGESRRIEVQRGSRHGTIYVKESEIYRAEAGEIDGDEAFFDILSWDRAVHSDSPQWEIRDKNLKISTDVYLKIMKSQTTSLE